jgi:hypothetical protein
MSNRDARLHRDGAERVERETEERTATQNREMTDEERLDALRANMFSNPLPNIPDIPGYHGIWLTTTNPRDTIMSRRRMGYEFVTAKDVPEWENLSLKTGEYVGCIAINEMIAMKLPLRLYAMYMKESHHDAPNREEDKLNATIRAIQEEAARAKARVDMEEGTAELGSNPRRPVFEGVDPN